VKLTVSTSLCPLSTVFKTQFLKAWHYNLKGTFTEQLIKFRRKSIAEFNDYTNISAFISRKIAKYTNNSDLMIHISPVQFLPNPNVADTKSRKNNNNVPNNYLPHHWPTHQRRDL